MKVAVLSVVVGSLGAVPNNLKKRESTDMVLEEELKLHHFEIR